MVVNAFNTSIFPNSKIYTGVIYVLQPCGYQQNTKQPLRKLHFLQALKIEKV
jgi:hypothetical protein